MRDMNEIRHHIRAVEQTRKITGAMHLISSARIRRIMPHMDYNRQYLERIESSMRHVLASSESFDHHYLRERKGKHATFIVVAGDKGMVGSYNHDVLRFAQTCVEQYPDHHLITMGIVAERFFRSIGMKPDQSIVGASQDPSLYYARHLEQDIFRLYDDHKTDRVYLIHMSYINSARWQPRVTRLLPIQTRGAAHFREDRDPGMIYHPSPEDVFALLVPQYTLGFLYGALMQAYASEHCARISAMQSATRNADEILARLKSQYNIARQSAITQEITEITGAALAQAQDGARR